MAIQEILNRPGSLCKGEINRGKRVQEEILAYKTNVCLFSSQVAEGAEKEEEPNHRWPLRRGGEEGLPSHRDV